ncbi:hypothetical protein B4589_017905 (plasmid) [Halolamina sp. CBA1230]|uniref:hypothetical protein n=1 Tax=Halolamina sp. CBA1230 TaxID=1853690 RepID=UPI0009A1DC0B|nr:hypothetical protein [Halolamina sp. CBA1230]QKY22271.1 hypothetical protein B4589_017905 [Halolamina sp. CBA1230]
MQQPPAVIAACLDGADEETLRATIAYCETQLETDDGDDTDESERDPEAPEGYDDEEWADAIDDCNAPTRATLTTKEINGNRYYYWQWSEGETTKSEYIAPVNPKR